MPMIDRRVGGQRHGGGDVEIDILAEQPLRSARGLEHVPEAEAHRAHMCEDEPGLRRGKSEVEQLLIVAGQDAGIVHQHDHASLPGSADDGEHPRVGIVELLGVGVDLEQLHAGRADAPHLGDRGVAVIGMDGRDRDQLGIGLGERDDRVVAGPDRIGIALARLIGSAEPHHRGDRIDQCQHRLYCFTILYTTCIYQGEQQNDKDSQHLSRRNMIGPYYQQINIFI